ncbi:MAG: 50S ribosomal protein L25/general stress protein Ctc [Pseudomonadales bacterium]
MSQQIQISAEPRQDVGKGASRRLRRLGERVPGIIYGDNKDAQPLTLDANELGKAMQNEAFYSQVLNVSVAGDVQQAVVRDLQRHPASNRVQHIDFLRVSADREIEVHVPLHFLNEEKCVGVRLGGGTITHNMTDVEVSCLPRDLPEYIEVNVADLEVGHAIHLSDLVLPAGVSVVALSYGADHDTSVVTVLAPRGAAQDEGESEAGPAEPAEG